jgi:hypothetical protein
MALLKEIGVNFSAIPSLAYTPYFGVVLEDDVAVADPAVTVVEGVWSAGIGSGRNLVLGLLILKYSRY